MSSTNTHMYNILYLEDEPDEILLSASFFTPDLPVQISTASTVKEAKHIIETTAFNLFILDIEIAKERCTGIQFAESIRQNPAYMTTPILFISSHTHYSHWLLSTIRNCSFLPKPFTAETLKNEIGIALGIPQYIKKRYLFSQLIVPGPQSTYLKVNSLDISYIEITNRTLFLQYIDGRVFQCKSDSGMLKYILNQINTLPSLRQIYRSIIVNVNQIKSISLEKNVANVYLFNEPSPLPLGIRYRDNLKDFL